MSSQTKSLAILFGVLVLDLIAFTSILPLFPSLIDFYAEEPHRDWLYDSCESVLRSFRSLIGAPDVKRLNSVFFGGFLGALFSFLQFISSPLLGALSDVYGRKRILLVSVCGTLVSYLIWARAETFTLFVLSRFIGGLSKASVSVATAIIADICPPAKRGRGMAILGIAFSVAFLIGPMIGAYYSRTAPNKTGLDVLHSTPAYFAICLTLLEMLLIVAVMPETLDKSKRVTHAVEVTRNWKLYVSPSALFNYAAVSEKTKSEDLVQMKSYGLVYFVYLLLYSGLEFTLTFFTHIRFHYNSMQQGRMYVFSGLLMVFIQGGYVRRVPAEFQARTAAFGLLAIIPSYIIIGFANSQLVFYLGLGLYAVASASVVPCLTSCVSSLASESDKGAVLGVFRSLGALARSLGPLIASGVFWLIGPTACYVIGGICLVVPYLLLKRMPEKPVIKSD